MDPVLFIKTQLLHAALSFITCTFRLNFHVERAVLASAFPARLSPGRLRGSHLDMINVLSAGQDERSVTVFPTHLIHPNGELMR